MRIGGVCSHYIRKVSMQYALPLDMQVSYHAYGRPKLPEPLGVCTVLHESYGLTTRELNTAAQVATR